MRRIGCPAFVSRNGHVCADIWSILTISIGSVKVANCLTSIFVGFVRDEGCSGRTARSVVADIQFQNRSDPGKQALLSLVKIWGCSAREKSYIKVLAAQVVVNVVHSNFGADFFTRIVVRRLYYGRDILQQQYILVIFLTFLFSPSSLLAWFTSCPFMSALRQPNGS